MGIGVNPTWTFREILRNIRTIKLQYEEVLSSFSIYEKKEEYEFRKKIRDMIYGLNIAEWKKDRLWEYVNDYQPYIVLQRIYERELRNAKRD